MKFTSNKIYINSCWFDLKGRGKNKHSIFLKYIGFNGFIIYLSLNKYFLRGQNEGIIHTSVDLISSDTKIKQSVVSDCLLLMEKKGIINIINKTKRKTLLDNKGCLEKDHLLIINLTDVPDTRVNDNDKFIIVETELYDWMINNKLNAKHVVVYHLLKKYTQGGKAWVSCDSEILANHIGMSNVTVLKLIKDLNEKRLVKTVRKKNPKGGIRMEHCPLWEFERWDLFKENYFGKRK